MDLIEDFLKYYNECDIVDQIQVVWSDQENKPPLDWIPRYKKDKVIFEEHHNNSLVNRFRCISPLHTEVRNINRYLLTLVASFIMIGCFIY